MTSRPTPHPRCRSGFSLITVSLLLAVGGIVVAGMLPGGTGNSDATKRLLTLQRMQAIEEATRGFMTANGRRPCPADGLQVRGTAYYGVEAAGPGTCTGGTPAAPVTDAATGTAAGTVPFRTLGLSEDDALDGWGNPLSYVVDRRLTMQLGSQVCGGLQFGFPRGNIDILNTTAAGGVRTDTTGWALVSHGRTGHGAWLPSGAGQLNAASIDPDTRTNAFVDANFNRSFAGKLVQKPATATFDSLIWFQPATKTTCVLGALAVPPGCTAPWGQAVVHGQSVTAWQAATVPAPASCASQSRLCTSGTLAGSYTFPSCSVLAQCTNVPGGGTMNSGQSMTFFSATTGSPCSALAQTRTCTDGTLNGNASYQYTSCANYCSLPWVGTITEGQSVTAYQTTTVPWGSTCPGETRTCTNAVLSGSYSFQTCTVNPPANCTLPAGLGGGTLAHGNSVTAYQVATVPLGNSCVSETRTCSNGTLGGSYQYPTCTAACALPWGGTLADGQSVTAYQAYAVLSTGTCNGESRTCTNGVLGGSFQNQSCFVHPASLRLWLDASDASTVTLTYSSNGVSGTVSGTSGSSTLTATANNTVSIPAGTRIRLGGAADTTGLASDTSNANTYTVTAITGGTITVSPALTATYAAGTALRRGLVSQLADKSGQANHATQATVGNMPLWLTAAQNGLAALQFDGTNSRSLAMTSTVTPHNSATLALVAKATSGSMSGNLFRTGSGNGWNVGYSNSYGNGNGNSFGLGQVGIRSRGTSVGAGLSPTVLSVQLNAAGATTLYRNGILGYTEGLTSNASNTTSTVGSGSLVGTLNELTFYGAALSASDRQSVEGYLQQRWAVPLGCALPWGGYLPGGDGVTAYQAATVASPAACVAEVRSCTASGTGGTLSGSYSNQTCTVTGGATTPASVAALKMWLDAGDPEQVRLSYQPLGTTATGASGASTLTVGSATGLVVGARVQLGGVSRTIPAAVTQATDPTSNVYTVSSIAGTAVGVSPALTAAYSAAAVYQGYVAQLVDKSGGGLHAAQSEAAAMPVWVSNGLNGRGVARFGGTHRLALAAPLAPTASTTSLIVTRPASGSVSGETLRSSQGGGSWSWQFGYGNTSLSNAGNNMVYDMYGCCTYATGVAYGTGANVAGLQFDASGRATLFLNGTSVYTAGNGAGVATSNGSIGASLNSATGFTGDVSEVIAYSTAPSTANRKAVEQYLGTKWGITVAP